jgi:hypothetical protein
MVGGGVVSAEPLGIVELGDVCARMRAQSLDLFRELGAWVSVADVGHQRWFATACHRHAWHAELWAGRSPAIPPVDLDAAVADARRNRLPDAPAATAYSRLLDAMLDELDELSSRVDPDIDPGTQRVLTLVRRDLADLRDH